MEEKKDIEAKEETIYDRLVDYGMLQYNAAQIAKCEGLTKIEVERLLIMDEAAKNAYEKAVAQSQYQMDLKILNLAMSGDANAIRMHLDRLAKAGMDALDDSSF
jgi:hypothetical protein